MKIDLNSMRSLVGKTISDTPSKAGNWLNLTLKQAEKGDVIVAMTIRPEMCNPYGMIHGGMMSLLVDEAIGWSIVSLGSDIHYTSLNLMVDFLYAAPEGEEISAHAYIVRQGKKIINAEVKVYNSDYVLLAKATSNLISTSMNYKTNIDA